MNSSVLLMPPSISSSILNKEFFKDYGVLWARNQIEEIRNGEDSGPDSVAVFSKNIWILFLYKIRIFFIFIIYVVSILFLKIQFQS